MTDVFIPILDRVDSVAQKDLCISYNCSYFDSEDLCIVCSIVVFLAVQITTWSPPMKKRKGGVRQRLEAERKEEDDRMSANTGAYGDMPDGKVALLLIYMYVWSLISPQLIQKIAQACVGDIEMLRTRIHARVGSPLRVEHFTVLEQLAKIGSAGQQPGHCRGYLEKILPSAMECGLSNASVWDCFLMNCLPC